MSRLGAAIILALLLSPLPAHADVWRCHQPNGTDLYTNSNQHPGSCEKYVPQVELGYVSGSSSSTQPSVAPSQPIPMEKPPALPETRREDTEQYTAVDEEQKPYDYFYPYYPYSGVYWFPFALHPRHHHGHHQHHRRSSSHGAVAHSSGHGGHGGHR